MAAWGPCPAPDSAGIRRGMIVTRAGQAPIAPARTCSEAAYQARAALRRFREAASSSSSSSSSSGAAPPDGPVRLTMRLPLPSPSRDDDLITNFDESDWPGGIQQRFRRLRPLIEQQLLEGYDAQFVGMLESPADGIGVWRAASGAMTVVCQVGNINFAPFAKLCAGEYGSAVLGPGHTLLVVNPTWTRSADIGQLWDRRLKAAAAALIDAPGAWQQLYCLQDVRTSQGATGLLFRSWPHDWELLSTCNADTPADALEAGAEALLTARERPTREEQTRVLNEALAAAGGRPPWWRQK